MTTLDDLERLARAATQGEIFLRMVRVDAMHNALSPERVLDLVNCVRLACAMRATTGFEYAELCNIFDAALAKLEESCPT